MLCTSDKVLYLVYQTDQTQKARNGDPIGVGPFG
jgi:hypothetical protein